MMDEAQITNKVKQKVWWKGFWQLADPKIWIASTVPFLFGTALAYRLSASFSLYWFVWSLIALYFLEIGKNALNEVIYKKSGVDRYLRSDERTPFSGGKKTIVDGLLSLGDCILIGMVTMAAGALIGLYIAVYRVPLLLPIGIAGFFFAVFYSLPPLKLAYRGGGEFAVGLTFGPLVVSGAYLVQAQSLPAAVPISALPIGFLIAGVLWINQYPDYRADTKGEKRNWVVRLGPKRGLSVYKGLFISAYLSLLLPIYFWGPLWLLPLLSTPVALRAVKTAEKHYRNIDRLVSANLKTIQVYQLTGLMLIIAALLT